MPVAPIACCADVPFPLELLDVAKEEIKRRQEVQARARSVHQVTAEQKPVGHPNLARRQGVSVTLWMMPPGFCISLKLTERWLTFHSSAEGSNEHWFADDMRELWRLELCGVTEVVTMGTRAVSRVFSNSKASFAVRYRLWIGSLFAWHTSHPEMSFHFLRMATQWFGSKQVKLTSAAIRLCCAVRYQGIRDLTLPLANGLLGVLHADMEPQARLGILELLEKCHAVYHHLNVKLVLELLESVISWKESHEEWQVRTRVRCIAAYMLEAILKDDEAFARANIMLNSMQGTDVKRNTDETAAKNQELIRLLTEATRGS
eukprot:s235_g30.t1